MDRLLDEALHVGFSQSMILLYVKKNPRVSQRHISHDRDITPAAVSRHIEALVQKGYILQKDNTENKREHILEVSDRGEELVEEMITLMNDELDRVFNTINQQEMDEIDLLFNKLLNVFGEKH